jgi:hypothetical protein
MPRVGEDSRVPVDEPDVLVLGQHKGVQRLVVEHRVLGPHAREDGERVVQVELRILDSDDVVQG